MEDPWGDKQTCVGECTAKYRKEYPIHENTECIYGPPVVCAICNKTTWYWYAWNSKGDPKKMKQKRVSAIRKRIRTLQKDVIQLEKELNSVKNVKIGHANCVD